MFLYRYYIYYFNNRMSIYHQHSCLDFFAGSGLVSYALREHFVTLWANDISPQKARVFRANHSKTPFELEDIAKISGSRLPKTVLSWGSFPCQDLSLAGKMSGLDGERSGLFYEWIRVMDEMPTPPPIAVAENVSGLVSAAGGDNYRRIHHELVKRGYHVGAVMLDASDWLPQSRKRVFVIAVNSSIDISTFISSKPSWCHPYPIQKVAKGLDGWVWWNLPRPTQRKIDLNDIIDWDAPYDDEKQCEHILSLLALPVKERIIAESKGKRLAFPAYKRTRNHKQVLEVRFDGIAGCLRTPNGGSSRQNIVIADGGVLRTRLLTVREAARLMGAPDSYELPGNYNDGYRAMGDAVAVPVASFLAKELLAPLADRRMGL
ncbi:MAG: DNA cytosine methyltransferase [Victivallales bacterium]|nr:DNA cytosine methyltransferase [Victivallales bacterium]